VREAAAVRVADGACGLRDQCERTTGCDRDARELCFLQPNFLGIQSSID
jgi:hypothetical protein